MGSDGKKNGLSEEIERLQQRAEALEDDNHQLRATINTLERKLAALEASERLCSALVDPDSAAHSPDIPTTDTDSFRIIEEGTEIAEPPLPGDMTQRAEQKWNTLASHGAIEFAVIDSDATFLSSGGFTVDRAEKDDRPGVSNVCDYLQLESENRQEVRTRLASALATGRSFGIESSLPGPDGSIRHLRSFIIPTRSQGHTEHAAFIALDVTESRQAVVSLAENEEIFRRTYEALPNPAFLWKVHPDGTITFSAFNPAAHVWSGGQVTEYVGMGVDEFFTGTPERPAAIRHAHATGETQHLPRKLQRMGATGEHKWISADYTRVNDRFVLNFIMDITEQVRFEQALRESEEKFRQVIAQSIDGILLVDEEGTIIEWTPSLEKITGLPREQAIGQPFWDVYHALADGEDSAWEDNDTLKTTVALALQEQQAANAGVAWEARIRQPDGRRRVLLCQASSVVTGSGLIVAVVFRDVSHAKRAERELRASESLLRQAQRVAQAGSWQQDPETGETVWSEGIFTLYGVDPSTSSPPYAQHHKFYHPDDWPSIQEAVSRAITEGIGYSLIVRVIRPDGSVHHVQIMCEPTMDASGRVTNLVGAAQDVTERKRVERELRESERLLKQAQRIAQIGSWRQDPISGKTVWSEGVFDIYGLDPGDGPPAFTEQQSSYHPDDWPMVRKAVERAAIEGIGYNLEVRVIRPDGTMRYVQTMCETARDASGQVTNLVGAIQDVSERKRVERDLRESEHLLQQAQRIAHIGSWQQDPITGRTVWSEGIFDIYRLDPAGGPPPYSEHHRHFHPDDWPILDAAVQQAISHGTPYSLELRLIRPYGEVREVVTMCEPVIDSDGNVTNLLGAIQDITERKRAERAIQERQAELNEVIRSLPNALVYTDTKRRIVRVNPAFTRIFGYEPDEVIGHTTEMLYSTKEEFAEQGRYRFDTAVPDSDAPYQVTYRRKTGEVFPSETIVGRVRNANGDVVGFLKVARDISDRLRLEEQLQQAQKMEAVGRLAGGVAHDFNNILTAIQGYVDFLMLDIPQTHPSHSDLEGIRQAAERATGLTRQLLAFSRRQVLAPQLVDLNEITANMSKMLYRLIGEDVELITRAAPQPTMAKVDPGQIEQVILNLAVNSRDAMPSGGTLTIETGETVIDETLACPCGGSHEGRCRYDHHQ